MDEPLIFTPGVQSSIFTPGEMLNFTTSITVYLKKSVSNKYDWNASLIRWVLAIKQPYKDRFILPVKFADLVPAGDVEYLRKTLGVKFVPNQAEYERATKATGVAEFPDDDNHKRAINRLESITKGREMAENTYKMYAAIGAMNTSIFLSVPPKLIAAFDLIELFASPFNFTSKFYSPFAGDVAYGSLGNMFDATFMDDSTYLANPPFDESLINEMASKIVGDLMAQKLSNFAIIVTIPVWDSKSQRAAGLRDYGLEFAAFTALTIPIKGYTTTRQILHKDKYPYWSYSARKYVPASNSHLICIASNDLTASKIMQFWSNVNHR
jgi:hypothetical protein